jgi:hypothetical protein
MSARRIKGVWWYGDMPVPATAMWSGERDEGRLAACEHVPDGHLALWCPERPGEGVPMFKNPHPVRQRRAMALMLCDICARPLQHRTKYLLGNLRVIHVENLYQPRWITQEPLVCRECLPLASTRCPFVRSWPERFPEWQPIIVRRWDLISTVVTTEALELTAGRGDYPTPAVAYIKLAPSV